MKFTSDDSTYVYQLSAISLQLLVKTGGQLTQNLKIAPVLSLWEITFSSQNLNTIRPDLVGKYFSNFRRESFQTPSLPKFCPPFGSFWAENGNVTPVLSLWERQPGVFQVAKTVLICVDNVGNGKNSD